MHLQGLPEDILRLIVQYLDTKSIFNLYHTNDFFKHLLLMRGVVKKCEFSSNGIATARTLKTLFFKDIAANLLELNLSGMPDLTKSYFIPALKKMKSLQTLDISYTNLSILDILDIYEASPTIINVALNFMLEPKACSEKIPSELMFRFQDVFRNFKKVHLFGSAYHLLFTNFALFILQDLDLECLILSLVVDLGTNIVTDLQFNKCYKVKSKKFFINSICESMYSFYTEKPLCDLPFLSYIDYKDIEGLIITSGDSKQTLVYSTEMFKNFFKNSFYVESDNLCHISNYKYAPDKRALFMIWSREHNVFDDKFFNNLKTKLKPCFPLNFQLFDGSVPAEFDCFYTTLDTGKEIEFKSTNDHMSVKQRIAPPYYVLNYDEVFKSKERLQLTINVGRMFRNPISLPNSCDYLTKLTYINLNKCVIYHSKFFDILFQNCVNLVTINVEANYARASAYISRSVHKSLKLRHFRLCDDVDFKFLFMSLGMCKTLENICVLENSTYVGNVDIYDPKVVVSGCPNLCYLFIGAPMSHTALKTMSRALRKYKTVYNRPYLNFMLQSTEFVRLDRSYAHHKVFDLYALADLETR